jgi:hypothetical protein
MSTWLRNFLKGGLVLAAIVLLPGALIGAPILWWAGHRRKTPQSTWKHAPDTTLSGAPAHARHHCTHP